MPTVVGSVGLNAVTTDFRAFGAIISFLPTVVDKDRIRLQVAPEFSQINSELTGRRHAGPERPGSATTTVEMREGQTLAIAGLLEDSYKATNVGDLPFLAKIFGRRDATRNETELIILVTPELVHPHGARRGAAAARLRRDRADRLPSSSSTATSKATRPATIAAPSGRGSASVTAWAARP